jgi:hypothetical protein
MILLLIAVLLGLIAAMLVLYPLLGLNRSGDTSVISGVTGDMSERERAAKQALLDIDFDYRLGNLDEEDYAGLRDRYEERALVALKARYEREQELDALIEQQLAALKSQEKKSGAGARHAAPSAARATTATRAQHGPSQRRRKGV